MPEKKIRVLIAEQQECTKISLTGLGWLSIIRFGARRKR